MTDKEEILKEIKKTKEHLANMKKMLEEYGYGKWTPSDNEVFYYVNAYLEVVPDYFSPSYESDRLHCENYNCFQTSEQAKQEAEKILIRRMLEDIARRLNKGEKLNWYKYEQPKYCISLYNDDIIIDAQFSYKTQGTVYCLDENFKDIAIQEIGEERLKKYLRGG